MREAFFVSLPFAPVKKRVILPRTSGLELTNFFTILKKSIRGLELPTAAGLSGLNCAEFTPLWDTCVSGWGLILSFVQGNM